MGSRNNWILRVAAVVIIGALAVLTAWVTARIGSWQTGQAIRQEFTKLGEQIVTSAERTVREQEEWAPEDFFSDAAAIRACEAISNRDQTQLQSLIDGGLNVNGTGKSGLTLLHWALVDSNFPAFKLLLESGADPDKKLHRFIFLHTRTKLVEGDSILFSCLRGYYTPHQLDYFYAALDHSRQADPRDAAGKTLLLFTVDRLGGTMGTKTMLARIIDQGVDLNAQNEYGDTAAMMATGHDRPDLALQILEAGADPAIRDHRGKSIADLQLRKLELKKGDPDYPQQDANRLLEWLKKNPASDERSTGGQP